MILTLTGCVLGTKDSSAWSHTGYFEDENGNSLSIERSEDKEHKGWFAAAVLEGEEYGWYITQEGGALHGNIVPDGKDGQLYVTVSPEGKDGLKMITGDGAEYHFTRSEKKE